MVDVFVKYMIVGLVITFLVELLIDWLISNGAMDEDMKEEWGWQERIMCVWIWPIALVVLIGGFINGKNK
jgi:hypothetical protein